MPGARKNHHFVPQFYFRKFSTDGKSICVLQRKDGSVVRHAPIKNQSSKNMFYGDDEAEQAISEVEATCSAALRKLEGMQDLAELNADERAAVLVHLALQRTRTQAAREEGAPIYDKLAQILYETEVNSIAASSTFGEGELLELSAHIKANPIAAQRLEMATAAGAANSLDDLVPVLLHNKTSRDFFFGDAPCVFYNIYRRHVRTRGVLGFSTPGLLVFLPLSARVTLMLFDSEVYKLRGRAERRIAIRSLDDVSALNRLHVHAASACIYFGDFSQKDYVRALWAQERKSVTRPYGRVVESPAMSLDGVEEEGEFVHTFQPQLNYSLKLSFLRLSVAPQDDGRLLRRAQGG